MSVSLPFAGDDLFYENLIESYLDNTHDSCFVERHWLKEQVERRLADPACRFVLLIAEPGAGKSAFMAWLAHLNPNWCRYFIRRDQRTPLGDPGAHSFLLQVGFQLAAIHPDLFNLEQVKITIAQRVGEAEDSEIVGANIGKLVASPFYQKVVEIQQEVTCTESSTVTGIRVGECYADNRSVPLTNLQFMALFDPALTLLRQNSDHQIIVAVDALDELRYRDRELSLLRWLADCPTLPSNLKFVLTARPDNDLLRVFRWQQKPYLQEISIAEDDPDVTHDLTQYVHSLSSSSEVRAVLTKLYQGIDVFIPEAVKRANGNFGYLGAIGRAVDQAIRQNQPELLKAALDLSQLPDTLQDLYGFFLSKIKDAVAQEMFSVEDAEGNVGYVPAWAAIYKPILSILSVALEPLNPEQIQKLGFLQIEFDDVLRAIEKLRQFLEQTNCGYLFYHSTVAEFLTSVKTKGSREFAFCYVDAVKQNQRIVNYYRRKGQPWHTVSATETYFWRYFTCHLYESGYQEELYVLLFSFEWLQAKLNSTNITALIQDYRFLHNDAVAVVEKTLQQAAHILEEDKTQLATQMLGRLSEIAPALKPLHQEIKDWKGYSWLRPLTASLATPSSLLRTLKGHSVPIWEVVATPDGKVISGAMNGIFKIWDIDGERAPLNVGEYTISAESDAESRYYTAVAVSPTGQYAIAALENGLVKVWNLTTGQLLYSLGSESSGRWVPLVPENEGDRLIELFGHPFGVPFLRDGNVCTCLERYLFRPSHQIILGDKPYRIIDPSNADMPDHCWANPDAIDALAVLPNGNQFISGSRDGNIKVWDLSLITNQNNSAQVYTLRRFNFPINILIVSSTGEILVTNRIDNRIWIINAQGKIESISLPNGSWRINALAITQDGRIVSGSTDGVIRISHPNSQDVAYVINAHADAVNALELTRNGLLVSASSDANIKLWNPCNGSLIHTIGKHYGSYSKSVNAVAITPDEKLISASEDTTLKVWNLNYGFEEMPFKGHDDEIRDIAVSQDGKVVSASKDGTLKIWNSKSGCALHSLQAHTDSVEKVIVTPEKEIVSASKDGTLKVWNLDSGELLKSFSGYVSKPGAIAATSLGVIAVSALEDGIIKLWSLSEEVEIPIIKAESHAINTLAITDEGWVLLGSNNGTIALWKLNESEEADFFIFECHERPIVSMTITQNKFLISNSDDSTIKVWKLNNTNSVELFHRDSQPDCDVISIAVSRDEKVFSGYRNGDLHMWDLNSGEDLWKLKGHDDVVSKVAFHPNNLFAVSTSIDRSLKVWDFNNGSLIATFSGDSEFVICEVLADGETIVVGDVFGQLHFLNLRRY